MDPIDRGVWFVIGAPFRSWDVATNPRISWYCRLPAFLIVLGIQYVYSKKS